MKLAALITFLAVWGVVSVIVQRRLRRSVKAVADGLMKMRRLQADSASYTPRGPADVVSPVVQAMFDAALKQLSAARLTMFGDYMERRADASARGPLRWFADEHQTVCGWFAVLESPKGRVPVMSLFSESVRGEFIFTGLGAASPTLAHPPTLTRIRLAWSEGVPAAFARHRAEQQRVAPGVDTWRAVTSADEAAALLERLRVSSRTWRAAQDKRTLIEADARGILGKHFDKIGPAVIRIVTAAVATQP